MRHDDDDCVDDAFGSVDCAGGVGDDDPTAVLADVDDELGEEALSLEPAEELYCDMCGTPVLEREVERCARCDSPLCEECRIDTGIDTDEGREYVCDEDCEG